MDRVTGFFRSTFFVSLYIYWKRLKASVVVLHLTFLRRLLLLLPLAAAIRRRSLSPPPVPLPRLSSRCCASCRGVFGLPWYCILPSLCVFFSSSKFSSLCSSFLVFFVSDFLWHFRSYLISSVSALSLECMILVWRKMQFWGRSRMGERSVWSLELISKVR